MEAVQTVSPLSVNIKKNRNWKRVEQNEKRRWDAEQNAEAWNTKLRSLNAG
jgi:hypothetical protein